MYPPLFSALLAIIVFSENARAFNFDTSFPIVYVDPYSAQNNNNWQTNKSSYFGYSVLLYEGTDRNNAWIQIGAPRGSNPNFENQTTGVVFRCGIKFPCNHVPLIPTRERDGLSSEAYFGNAMDISGDKDTYAVCGHRWIAKYGSEYHMQGACFAGNTDEDVTGNRPDFLSPLYQQNGQTEVVGGHRIYNKAQAQLGFSAQFTQNNNELLVGLPGLLNWKGSPGLLSKSMPPEAARRRSRTRRALTSPLVTLGETLVPDAIGIDEIKFFDLAGYSLTSGHFYQTGGLYYVAGAPRATQKGSVLVFQFKGTKVIVRERKDGVITGEYFGSAVTVANLNGDGFDDLIVGAPFHKAVGSNAKYDGGAVYIYLGSKDKLVDASTNIIEGKTTGGRFGESLMGLGDIDRDGCQDIAVAAPYENENSGVVYIFRGDRRLGLIKEPSQIINGKEILPDVRGFGISFSKPADIDRNNYADLAIGAYKSGHAVILRAKPVVVLEHILNSSVAQISAQSQTTKFQISSCISFSGEAVQPPINIIRTVSVDKAVPERAYLEAGVLDSEMLQPNEKYCQTYTVGIRENNKNIYDPIVIRALVDLKNTSVAGNVITITHGVTQGVDRFCKGCAILRSVEDTAKQISIDFNRGCGEDNVCDSNLQLTSSFIGLENENYIIGSKDFIILETYVSNSGENAFQTEVTIALPNPIRLKRIPTHCTEVMNEISCTIDNPLKKDEKSKISLELDLDEVNTGKYQNDLEFSLRVRTSSNNHGEIEKKLSLPLIKNADLELIGKSSDETYSYFNRTYGTATFHQIFKVLKYDVSPIQKAQLTVKIPTTLRFEDRDVTFLSLYAPEGSLAGQAVTCRTDIDTIMADDLPAGEDVDKKKKRKRRDIPTAEEVLLKYPANRTIYFNCTTQGVICGSVVCDLGPFRNIKHIAEVKFKMVLNISELPNYFPEKDIVIVSTTADIVISDSVGIESSHSHHISVPSVFIGPAPEQSVATWIIVVAVLCGILLLLVVAGILYKLGFFERKKKDLLMEEKAKQNAVRTDD